MAMENTVFLSIFAPCSSIAKSVYDCRLPSVIMWLCRKSHFKALLSLYLVVIQIKTIMTGVLRPLAQGLFSHLTIAYHRFFPVNNRSLRKFTCLRSIRISYLLEKFQCWTRYRSGMIQKDDLNDEENAHIDTSDDLLN